MTPGGRISAAIEILDEILGGEPAERALTRWARSSRFAGSKDRAAVRDHVFDVLRQRRSAQWLSGAAEESGRSLLIGQLTGAGEAVTELFSGDGHAPHPLCEDEAARLRPCLDQAPEEVRADLPGQIEDILCSDLGERCAAAMAAQRHRAPVDLRVNTLKADKATAQRLLAVEGIDAVPVDNVSTALRIRGNARKLAACRAYRYGFVELQDAASQVVSLLGAPKPGERVLDLCAGGGGKTLALGAIMGGKGEVWAYDKNPRRMTDLPKRAARAGLDVRIVEDDVLDGAQGRFDLVFVDAPCSGSGSWRRDPDNKWRLQPEEIARLTETQAAILDRAATLVSRKGRIVYTTCSILRRENAAQAEAFVIRSPEFTIAQSLALMPGEVGDGFFVAILRPSAA